MYRLSETPSIVDTFLVVPMFQKNILPSNLWLFSGGISIRCTLWKCGQSIAFSMMSCGQVRTFHSYFCQVRVQPASPHCESAGMSNSGAFPSSWYQTKIAPLRSITGHDFTSALAGILFAYG